jgi:isopentenyl-diphosphate Delta-isomerase
MNEERSISRRKSDHIQINLEENVQSGLTTGLEKYRFIHRALPELDLDAVDLSTTVFGKKLNSPILISSMTGGTSEAETLNQTLAAAAQETGIAMGVGSQRAAIEHPDLINTFRVRQVAPNILLFANLGAIQLNYRYGIDECQRAVDMIEADALILHLNSLQEAVQTDGDTHFAGLLNRIELVCKKLAVPVIIKEVGWGFSEPDVRGLFEAGVTAIDVAGAGGTSWSQVEMYRAKDPRQARLAAAFIQWGIPTAEAILNVRRIAPQITVFASGGLRSGVDIAKCLALGARLGGMAGPFLKAASQSLDETIQRIWEVAREIQVCMFAAGAKDLQALQQEKLVEIR